MSDKLSRLYGYYGGLNFDYPLKLYTTVDYAEEFRKLEQALRTKSGMENKITHWSVYTQHTNGGVSYVGTYKDSSAATAEAERLAQYNKGTTYFVCQVVPHSKSFVAPAPAITTKL